jgi:integrase
MNRLTPIQSTIQTIAGYPKKLIVYKTAASRYYWCRVYFNSRYHTKTTKTEVLKDAKKYAVQFYEEVLSSAHHNKRSDTTKSFAAVARHFLDTQSKNAKHTTHRNDAGRFKSDLLPVFGEQDVSTITNSQISQLLDRLRGRGLSPATQKHFLVVLSKIMKFAVEHNLMMRLPTFPKVSGRLKTATRRDYFTYDEYILLCDEAQRCADNEVIVRGVPITQELKYLFQFMLNTFIRPSDLRVIKFKHLQLRKDGRDEWYELTHPATKTNANAVQAMPATVGIVKKLVEFKNKVGQGIGKDDYVFFNEYKVRDTAMSVIARQFREVLKRTGLEEGTGKNLTLYSLRHSAIMIRLERGQVDTLVLARNARTSQQMIDQFYAQHLTTDQVRRQFHSFVKKETPSKPKKTTQSSTKKPGKTKSAPPIKTPSKHSNSPSKSVRKPSQ